MSSCLAAVLLGLCAASLAAAAGECQPSLTKVNNKAACKGAIIFEDHFDSLDRKKWHHTVKISGEDFEFVTYDSLPANSFAKDSKLYIKPTILTDEKVKHEQLNLEGCTGVLGSLECSQSPSSYNILPPVQSARLSTKPNFSFRYGTVTIRAKLPLGDWIIPQLWLEPMQERYGHLYPSGKIRIASVRGNEDLQTVRDTRNIGTQCLESGVLMGTNDRVRGRTITMQAAKGWNQQFHNYTLTWTPDNIFFNFDGNPMEAHQILPKNWQKTMAEAVGFQGNELHRWASGGKNAPFDTEFYISLGVSVGGIRDFPDNSISKGIRKPWRNGDPKARLTFWQAHKTWSATWRNQESQLEVDYIQVSAL